MQSMRDDSERFILDPDHPYLANLAELWAANARVAAKIERDDVGPFPEMPARSVALPNSKVCRETFAFAVSGFGPHVVELFERTGGKDGQAIFAIFEPDLVRLRAGLGSINAAEAIRSGRIVIIPGDASAEDVADALKSWPLLVSLGLTVVPADDDTADEIETRRAMLAALSAQQHTHVVTTLEHGRKSSVNVLKNLHDYAENPGVGPLRGGMDGRTAIVVSAGPSLRRNMHQLRGREDEFIIIAVQTALRPLLEAGIEPHYVCSIDHHEISTRFYVDLPSGFEDAARRRSQVQRCGCCANGSACRGEQCGSTATPMPTWCCASCDSIAPGYPRRRRWRTLRSSSPSGWGARTAYLLGRISAFPTVWPTRRAPATTMHGDLKPGGSARSR